MAAITPTDLLLLAHVVLFVYWLGSDVAVLYGASFAANPKLSGETRQTVSEIMAFVDLFPRLSVPLVGMTGYAIASARGLIVAPMIADVLVYCAGALWFANNLTIHALRKQPARIKQLRRLDLALRIAVMLAAAGAAGVALSGGDVIPDHSIAAKVLVFAFAIGFSLALRFVFAPYRPALNRILASGSTPEDEAIMSRALSTGRPIVLGIWACTLIAAAIGLWHPF